VTILGANAQICKVVGANSPVIAAPSSGIPKLVVVVDTEEEFDWSRPFSRAATNVSHIKYQYRTQRIFERYRITPTYVVDFSIASQAEAYGPLREWLNSGKCEIGAHLHPWVNPPYDEDVSNRNSFPGNLPKWLEREKLARLTDIIAVNFGRRPKAYRAGRYGIGIATGAILEELGYQIDTSIVPLTNFSDIEGPDFGTVKADLFWFGPSARVLEVPLTVGWCGLLRRNGDSLRQVLMNRVAHRFHLPGVFARLGLFERIRLTPEGTSFAELKRLTDTQLTSGNRIFVFSYHSPSVMPGNTPYVRDEAGLQNFLGLIDRYCEYFIRECGGMGSTLEEVYAMSGGPLPEPSAQGDTLVPGVILPVRSH
jgi:hypothetical protein